MGTGENRNGTERRNGTVRLRSAFRVSSQMHEIRNWTFRSVFHPF